MARNAEAQIQAAIVAWVRRVAPQTQCFSVPNGVYLANKRLAAFLVWTGVLRGVPDIIVLHKKETYFIEVKTETGALSSDQKDFFNWLERHDRPKLVARSITDVKAAFDRWGIETREAA